MTTEGALRITRKRKANHTRVQVTKKHKPHRRRADALRRNPRNIDLHLTVKKRRNRTKERITKRNHQRGRVEDSVTRTTKEDDKTLHRRSAVVIIQRKVESLKDTALRRRVRTIIVENGT